jgi:hypothetical protein
MPFLSRIISKTIYVFFVQIVRALALIVRMKPSDSSSSAATADSPQLTFSVWKTFKHHIPRFLMTMLMDVILPLGIYLALQKPLKPVYALLIASSPPFVMVIFKALWSRTFDALGFLVFFTFALSAVVAIATRNPIVLLLEKSMVTGFISLMFAFTLIPFSSCHHRCRLRPLAYYFYQDLVPTKRFDVGLPDDIFNSNNEYVSNRYTKLNDDDATNKLSSKKEVAAVYEWIYVNCSSFRYSCYLITSIWAVGFLFEFLARLILIFVHLPINSVVLYGHAILSTITVICIVSTITSITIERKHTLRYIQQWKSERTNEQQQQQQQPSIMLTSLNTDKNNGNDRFNRDV